MLKSDMTDIIGILESRMFLVKLNEEGTGIASVRADVGRVGIVVRIIRHIGVMSTDIFTFSASMFDRRGYQEGWESKKEGEDLQDLLDAWKEEARNMSESWGPRRPH
jgi:hypothetical protein